jgi:S1-C subfamily serine protease
MATRIIVRHLSGSKVNQIEQFPIEAFSELTIGRDQGSTILFDAVRDDAVSRKHAIIKVEQGDHLSFKLDDLGSNNGTLLNGEKITGETELLPGDTIEFGRGGPKIGFDLEPRPKDLVARTRLVSIAGSSATRVIDAAEAAPPPTLAATVPFEGVTRSNVGRNTLLHELSVQRQATRQIVVYASIGVLVVIAAVGSALYYTHQKSVTEQNARIAEGRAQLEANAKMAEQSAALVNAKIETKIGLTPKEIAERFGNATVMIRAHWRLYDRTTGRSLFHKTISVKYKDGTSELLPAYVNWKGKVVRWLTLDDDMHTNYPVGDCNCEVSGTGFVIDPQGRILTNKHVVAGWMINYNRFSYYEKGHGVIYDEVDPRASASVKAKLSRELNAPSHVFDVSSRPDSFKGLIGWMPEEGGPIFANLLPIVINDSSRGFEGRNEELSVRFPGTRTDVSAQLVRASPDADVALIKIDAIQTVTHDVLADGDKVDIGEPVVVLGYPGASVENRAIFDTVENAEVHHHNEIIPEPTVTSGVVSMKGSPLTKEGNLTLFGRLGEVYQMTVTASAGNSGGPVFDREGKVIGLFTYVSRRETETFAVPIKYARELMQLQRIN